MVKKQIAEKKKNGRVYTPEFVVCNILDMIGYTDVNILKKNIIDNSCGNGAFLTEIVKRYCEIANKSGLSVLNIKYDLENYIFGIELDKEECQACRENLDAVVKQFDIFDVKWNVVCQDTLKTKQYDGIMDYVVGNPPYVRVHNLDNLAEIKSFQFSKEGMTDLYIVFFEIGLNMLKPNGVLGYITPSSYFTSKSGRIMRKYIIQNNLLTNIVDFKHAQIFNAMTYCCITVLDKKNRAKDVNYYEYDLIHRQPFLAEKLSQDDYMIGNCFYFSKKQALHKLKNILSYTPILNQKEVQVKNGFATLLDDFFIQDSLPFNEYTIPILKSSTGKWKQCFYPYKNGKIVPFEILQKNDNIKRYYLSKIALLKNKANENTKEWWGFGRTQGLNDVFKVKYSINSLIRTRDDIKLVECKSGSGVYSGLYILTNIEFEKIRKALVSQEFVEYVALLGKYKSGGYYTFSSKDVKCFLDYTLLKD